MTGICMNFEKNNFSIHIPNSDQLRTEGSHHNVSAYNRNKHFLQVVNDRQYHRKDSFVSKHRQHSSTNVTDSSYSDTVSKQVAFHGRKAARRRSRSNSAVSRTNDTGSSVFQENPRNNALKSKTEKKPPQLKSLLNETHCRHSGEEARDDVKIAAKPLLSSGAKHKKLLPATKHDVRKKVVVSSDDKNRKIIKTARGFLMTVDSRR